jgi:hypothetical protein
MKKPLLVIIGINVGMFVGVIIILGILRHSTNNYSPGDLCSIMTAKGDFRVAKVLIVNSTVIHLRIYKNKYSARPTQIDLTMLDLGTASDTNGLGIKHVAVIMKVFLDWQPKFIVNQKVIPEELEDYQKWKETNGSVVVKIK